MTETQLKNSVKKWVSSVGGYSIKISDKFTSGIPDLWICINGRQIWIELKTEKGVVSQIQQWTISQINQAGGKAVVCRSLKEVQDHFGIKSTVKS